MQFLDINGKNLNKYIGCMEIHAYVIMQPISVLLINSILRSLLCVSLKETASANLASHLQLLTFSSVLLNKGATLKSERSR